MIARPVPALAWWLAIAVAGLGSYSLGAAVIGGPAPHVRAWQALYGVGCVGYLAALVGLRHATPRAATLMLAATVVRLPFLLTPPDSDVYRYAWEGRIQWAGFNPYSFAPDSPALADLRNDDWRQIQKKEYTTIYPPLAQVYFAAVAAVSHRATALQIAAAAADLAVVAVLLDTLRQLGRPVAWAAVYAFCPLVLASFSQAGHVDALMLLALVLFLRWLALRSHCAAAAALGAAILAKTVPLILAPLLWRARRSSVLVALAVVGGGYLLYADAGVGLFRSMLSFPMQDRFNCPFDAITANAVPQPLRNASAAVALIAVTVGVHFRMRRPEDASRWLLGAVLLTLPIVHFWYVSWVLAVAALHPAGLPKWLVLSVTMGLYWNAPARYAAGGAWRLGGWEVATIWMPFVAAAAWEWFRSRQRAAGSASARLSGVRPDALALRDSANAQKIS